MDGLAGTVGCSRERRDIERERERSGARSAEGRRGPQAAGGGPSHALHRTALLSVEDLRCGVGGRLWPG